MVEYFRKELSWSDTIFLATMAPYANPPDWFRRALIDNKLNKLNGVGNFLLDRHMSGVFLKEKSGFGLVDMIPKTELSVMNLELIKTTLFSAAATEVSRDVMSKCNDIGVSCIFIKGAISRSLYRCEESRCISDVDVLVPKANAVELYLHLLAHGYESKYDSLSLGKFWDDIETESGHYELPELWREVELDVDNEDLIAQSIGNSKRFLVGNKLYAKIPIEIHYDLFPGADISYSTKNTTLQDGLELPGLPCDVALLYVAYKAYIDIMVFKKLKAAKLFSDFLRILYQFPNEVWTDHMVDTAQALKMTEVLKYFLKHAINIYGLSVPDEILQRLCPIVGDWAMGDFIDVLLDGSENERLKFIALRWS